VISINEATTTSRSHQDPKTLWALLIAAKPSIAQQRSHELGTNFSLLDHFQLKAMRLYTDDKWFYIYEIMFIEIGGVMSDDGPTQKLLEAA